MTGRVVPPDEIPKGLMLMYTMGAGKTMPSIAIALTLAASTVANNKDLKNSKDLMKQVIVVCNASIRNNYQKEIRNYIHIFQNIVAKNSEFIGNESLISYISLMKTIENRVKFITLNGGQLYSELQSQFQSGIKKSVIIVDEAHNFFNAIIGGSKSKTELQRLITQSSPDTKVIFLTGTPMINTPFELVPCINMLSGKEHITTDYILFEENYIQGSSDSLKGTGMKNLWDLQNRCMGLVSFSAGDQSNFPTQRETIILNIPMEGQQLQEFILMKKKEIEAKQGGFLPPIRLIRANQKLIDDLSGSVHTQSRQRGNGVILADGEIQSPKAEAIVNFILNNDGIHFIYSQFLSYGIDFVKEFLRRKGFKSYTPPGIITEPGLHFTEITGEVNDLQKKDILENVNKSQNKNGDYIRVVLGSSASAEGINFKNIRYVHIMEPYWNEARTRQVIARARRNNSHKDLEPSQQFVQPIIYCAVPIGREQLMLTDILEKVSIDRYILEISSRKQNLIDQVEGVMKQISINCSSDSTHHNCIICQNTGEQLFDLDNIGVVAENRCIMNDLMSLIKEDENMFSYNGQQYLITNKALEQSQPGLQVYKYNEEIKAFLRITGFTAIKILTAYKVSKKQGLI